MISPFTLIMELNVFCFLLNEKFISYVYIFKLLFCFPVHMSIMVKRRIWQLRSLNQLMLGDAFPVGMNLLARCHNLSLNLRSFTSLLLLLKSNLISDHTCCCILKKIQKNGLYTSHEPSVLIVVAKLFLNWK